MWKECGRNVGPKRRTRRPHRCTDTTYPFPRMCIFFNRCFTSAAVELQCPPPPIRFEPSRLSCYSPLTAQMHQCHSQLGLTQTRPHCVTHRHLVDSLDTEHPPNHPMEGGGGGELWASLQPGTLKTKGRLDRVPMCRTHPWSAALRWRSARHDLVPTPLRRQRCALGLLLRTPFKYSRLTGMTEHQGSTSGTGSGVDAMGQKQHL